MTATNHALTGAVIGLVIGSPVALVIALISHYILDAMPHFALDIPHAKLYKSRFFKNYLIGEALICFSIVLSLTIMQPVHWVLAAFCAFIAASPDLLSINQYVRIRYGLKWRPNLYSRFAGGIQWFERPIGAVVEVIWATAMLLILVKVA